MDITHVVNMLIHTELFTRFCCSNKSFQHRKYIANILLDING